MEVMECGHRLDFSCEPGDESTSPTGSPILSLSTCVLELRKLLFADDKKLLRQLLHQSNHDFRKCLADALFWTFYGEEAWGVIDMLVECLSTEMSRASSLFPHSFLFRSRFFAFCF